MKIYKIFFLTAFSICLWSCETPQEPSIISTWEMDGAYLGLFNDSTYIELGKDFDEVPGKWEMVEDTLILKFYGQEKKLLLQRQSIQTIIAKNLNDSSLSKMNLVENYVWAEGLENLSNPERNFEKFWQDFENNYAFFELRQLDWKASYAHYRPLINENTSDSLLYEYMTSMLKPFDDGHVRLDRQIENERPFISAASPSNRYHRLFNREERKELNRITIETLSNSGCNEIRVLGNGLISYCLADYFGYIKISRFYGVGNLDLESELDSIIEIFKNVSGIVIDVRNNFGGQDAIAYQFANRFVDNRRVGHLRKQRNGPNYEEFGDFETFYLDPANRKTYTKPIYILTNSAVFSAAETFVLAMKSLPYVTVIGNDTKGMLSDMLERVMFNGWDYQLSHQRSYSSDSICYEKIGIPPDIRLLHEREDLFSKTDPLILKSIQQIEMLIETR